MANVNTLFDITDEQREKLRALTNHLNVAPNSPPPSQDLTDQISSSLNSAFH
jgi:hypothetical protein